ncbi:sigma-54-dependent Fis family transcriptional regulator [Flavobacterium sp. MAH-1]|uniref:Sigma-54-dependent Fis family transcriptional regulator n=1 Tax=Flavobacterium agri TaxID=2743471 RepID=A0A7Y8Y128_9FLAO|nr:sigma-54 dependent transcriptional regulator [Flavobacterium agri]NUY80620.1 sigma-54-dependent Fis family transcriptional regulator [Flavobacterium agri]NYA70644.1 sigma-54-dependent Fis family transcriptional regulator [Flavobacterium agri]
MRKKQAAILVVDDQEEILFAAKMALKKHFEAIHTTSNPRTLYQLLAEHKPDVVMLDMNYRIGFEDGREGIHWLREITSLYPNTAVVLMTAFGKIETAVEGIKIGAFDYMMKPWENEKLLDVVEKAVAESRRRQKKPVEFSGDKSFFIGTSPKIKQAYSVADKVARTDANILLLGENGTGKYVMAEYIHRHSNRKDQPFVHVDLGSLSDNLFESELFGYAKGAFTDAKTDTAGRFETAQGGTIFLDEIGNVPLHLQAKLLSVLQTKSVVRLGESKPRALDVRIISATNINISEEVRKKHFREDLFYRINTMEITLPPLRERQSDILPLAEFLLADKAEKYNLRDLAFDGENLDWLERYPWPGNIREMENKIERAVILNDSGKISVSDLDVFDYQPQVKFDEDSPLSDLERQAIEKALAKHSGNISKTADELGLSRPALYRRLEKYNIGQK